MKASNEEFKIKRDILGAVLASASQEEAIDIDQTLKYPLRVVCAPLFTADDQRKKQAKAIYLKH